jgi:hypothetical protein
VRRRTPLTPDPQPPCPCPLPAHHLTPAPFALAPLPAPQLKASVAVTGPSSVYEDDGAPLTFTIGLGGAILAFGRTATFQLKSDRPGGLILGTNPTHTVTGDAVCGVGGALFVQCTIALPTDGGSADVVVTPVANAAQANAVNDTVTLTLLPGNPVGGAPVAYSVGSPGAATATVMDDDDVSVRGHGSARECGGVWLAHSRRESPPFLSPPIHQTTQQPTRPHTQPHSNPAPTPLGPLTPPPKRTVSVSVTPTAIDEAAGAASTVTFAVDSQFLDRNNASKVDVPVSFTLSGGAAIGIDFNIDFPSGSGGSITGSSGSVLIKKVRAAGGPRAGTPDCNHQPRATDRPA